MSYACPSSRPLPCILTECAGAGWQAPLWREACGTRTVLSGLRQIVLARDYSPLGIEHGVEAMQNRKAGSSAPASPPYSSSDRRKDVSISQTDRDMQRDIDKLAAALKEIWSMDASQYTEEYGDLSYAYALGQCKGIAIVALRETGNAD